MKEVKIIVKSTGNHVKSIEVNNIVFINEFIQLVEGSIEGKDLEGDVDEINIIEEGSIIAYGIDNELYVKFITLIKYYIELESYNDLLNKNNKAIEIHYDIDQKVTIRL